MLERLTSGLSGEAPRCYTGINRQRPTQQCTPDGKEVIDGRSARIDPAQQSEEEGQQFDPEVAEGARAAGADVESFDLHAMSIKPCDACDYCQGLGYGQCAIDDDMQVLYPKLIQAESLVIATPIYWFTISAQAKLCIDRWYALQGSGGSALAGKKIGIILTYGDDDPFTSGAINAMRAFQDMFRYVGAKIAGFVYATASRPAEIESKPEVLARAYKLGRQLGATA